MATATDDTAPDKLTRQQNELFRRVLEGSLDAGLATEILQDIMGGKTRRRSILKTRTALTLPAHDGFVVSEHFAKDSEHGPKIGCVYDFKKWFYDMTVEPEGERELRVNALTESSRDDRILAELGEKAETTLGDAWAMIARQPNGEKGNLLVNGYWNVFYVRRKGFLRAVRAYWNADYGGWNFLVSSVERPGGWSYGVCIVSRNQPLGFSAP